jgi:hypothetical protein
MFIQLTLAFVVFYIYSTKHREVVMRLMKIKMFCMLFLFTSGIFLSIPQKADAEILWATVSVVRLNQEPGRLVFWTDEINGTFTNKPLFISKDHPKQKEFLAILLTAISIGENLRVRIDTATDHVNTIGTYR